jgi:hypothetical protein
MGWSHRRHGKPKRYAADVESLRIDGEPVWRRVGPGLTYWQTIDGRWWMQEPTDPTGWTQITEGTRTHARILTFVATIPAAEQRQHDAKRARLLARKET